MIDLEEDTKIRNLKAIHLQCGCYQISLFSNCKETDFDELIDKATSKLVWISKKIKVDKPMMNVGEVA